MRNPFNHVFLLTMLILSFYSCSEEKEIVEESLEVFNELRIFDETGGDQSVSFLTTSDWSAQTDQNWCTVNPSKGLAGTNKLTISVLANDDYFERNATLILKSGSKEKRMTITQKQKDALLLSSSKQEMNANGGIVEVEISSNLNYSYAIEESAVDWIVPISDRGLTTSTVKFKVKENLDENNRQGTISFIADKIRETYTIYQQGQEAQFILTKNNYNVDPSGDEIKVELKSNLPYEIQLPDVAWIRESKSRALSTYTHYFKILPNEKYEDRTTEIVFKQQHSGLTETVKIHQYQKNDLLIDQSEFKVGAEGKVISLDIQTNMDFKVTCENEWIKQRNDSRGLETHRLEFVVAKNPNPYERNGVIIIEAEDVVKEVRIKQEAFEDASLEILNTLNVFTAKGGMQQLNINAKADWKAHVKQSWCAISPFSGKEGKHTIRIQVDPINNVSQRTDTLFLTSGKVTKKVPIVQRNEDALIIVTPDLHITGENDTIIKVQLKSSYDVKYEIAKNASSWIVPSEASRGLTEKEIQFLLIKNTLPVERKGVITFITGDKKQDLTILQDGRGLQIQFMPKSFQLPSNEGEFEVKVTTNFKYEVYEGNNPWVKVLDSKVLPTENPGYTTTVHRFKASKNDSIDSRSCLIYFLNTEYKDQFGQVQTNYLRVSQDAAYVIRYKTGLYNVSAAGAVIDFNVVANVKYTMSESDPWIHKLPPTRSSDDSNLDYQYKIDPNLKPMKRTGYIMFHYRNQTKRIEIRQKAFEDFGVMVTDSLKDFSGAGGTQVLGINASEKWTVTSDQKWCKISPDKGEEGGFIKLNVTTEPNTGFEDRKANLIFVAGKHTVKVPVLQKQQDYFKVEKDEYIIGWNTEKFDMIVNANCPYTVTVAAPWIKRKEASKAIVKDAVTFTVEKNIGNENREALVTFEYLNKKKQVKVVQKCMDALQIETPNVTVEGVKDTLIKVKTSSTDNVKYVIDEAASKWIIPQNSKAIIQSEFLFKVLKSPNVLDRKGTINFSSGEKKAVYTVSQKGIGLQIDCPELVQIDNKEQRVEVEVTSNFKYKIVFDGTGLVKELSSEFVAAKKEGFVTTKHIFFVQKNDGLDSRTMDLKFVNTDFTDKFGNKEVHKLTINQQGTNKILVTGPDSYKIPAHGQNISVDVASNIKYNVKVSADWIEQLPNSKGLQTSQLNFKIQKSYETKERKGEIVLSAAGCEAKVLITQEAFNDYGIVVTQELTKFDTKGGEQELKFNSSRAWNAVSTKPWCTLSVDHGAEGEGKIMLKVTPNTEHVDRTATIVIIAGSTQKNIEVVQKQLDFIEVPKVPQVVKWEKSQLTVNLKANCEYNVNYTEDWISCSKKTPTSMVLDVKENQNITPREAKITVVAGDVQQEFLVKQEAHPVEISVVPAEVNVNWKPQLVNVKVNHNSPDYQVECKANWLGVTKNATGLTLNIKQHDDILKPREALVVLSYAGKQITTLKVIQGAKSSIEVSPLVEVDYNIPELAVDVKSDVDFTVTESADWITKAVATRNSVVLTLTPNKQTAPREADVVLQADGVKTKFTVRQKGHPGSITVADEVKVKWNQAEQLIDVTTNGEFSATPVASWIKSAVVVGKQVKITLEENTGEVRRGDIKIKCNTSEKNVTIVQDAKPSFKVVRNPLASYKGGSHIVEIESNYSDFECQESSPLFEVTSKNKNSITLKWTANNEINQRKGKVTLSKDGVKSEIEVIQEGQPVFITPDKDTERISYDTRNLTIGVNSNCKFTAQSNKDWITPQVSGNNVQLTIQDNQGDTDREAEITLKSTNLPEGAVPTSAKIRIIQSKKYFLTINKTDYKVGYNETQLNVGIQSSTDNLNLRTSDSWIDIEHSVTTANSIRLVLHKNYGAQRTGSVTVQIAGKDDTQKRLTITQEAKPSISAANPGTLKWNDKQVFIQVTTTCNDYRVEIPSAAQEWLSKDPSSTKNLLKLNVKENTSFTERSSKVRLVSTTDSEIFKDLTITQSGQNASISVEPNSLNVDWKATAKTIVVTANGDYEVTDAPWVHATKVKEGKNTNLKLTIDQNNNEYERQCYVSLKLHGQTASIHIVQGFKTISVEKQSYNIGSVAGTIPVQVTANCDYTANSDQLWIRQKSIAGNTLTLEYDENKTYSTRSAKITLTPIGGGKSVSFEVSQNGSKQPTIQPVSTQRVAWDASSLTVPVKSDCVYNISVSNGAWLQSPSTSQNNDGIIFTINEKNPGLTERTAHVTLTSQKDENVKQEFDIIQEGQSPSFSIVDPIEKFNADGTNQITVQVGANCDYEFSNNGSVWLAEVSHTNNQLVLKAAATDQFEVRTAEVTLTTKSSPSVPGTFSISQEGKEPAKITVSDPQTLNAEASDITVPVTSVYPYTAAVTQGSDWLSIRSLNPHEGDLTLHATANSTLTERSAQVKLTSTVGSAEQTITVKQNGQTAAITVDTQKDMAADSTSLDLPIQSNCEYTVAVNAAGDWLKPTSTSGSGNGSLKFIAAVNPAVDDRTATITITSSDGTVSKVVTVTQKGQVPSITGIVSPLTIEAAENKSIEVKLTANCNYEVIIPEEATWLKEVEKTSTVLKLSAEANTTETQRTATIAFKYKESELAKLTINQKASATTKPDVLVTPTK